MTSVQRDRIGKLLRQLSDSASGKKPHALDSNRPSDGDPADEDAQPLNEMLQSIASNRNQNQSELLAKVAKARAKLEEQPDEFGLCEECGEPLPYGRLCAMPYAEYCVGCQAARDKPKGSPTRRKLTDYR